MARLVGRLGRHFFLQNLVLLGICLATGTLLYLLMDLFDRLDDFVSAGLGLGTVLRYYGFKVALIVSQILPAVFLIALIIQMGVMARSRELMALRAGGVTLGWFFKYFILLGLFWSLAQLAFSQYLGVLGEQEASRIWKEDVRGKSADVQVIENLWFRDGDYIVNVGEVEPEQGRARDLTIYEFDFEGRRLERVVSADQASMADKQWALTETSVLDTRDFLSTTSDSLYLDIDQDMGAFAAMEARQDRTNLPLWDLAQLIQDLERSGSNVEALRTDWHARWSYAFLILVMALVALALTTITENVYAGVGLSLVLLFIQYSMHTVGLTAGQQGAMPPMLAAWMGNLLLGSLAVIRLWWVASWRVRRAMRRTGNELRRFKKRYLRM